MLSVHWWSWYIWKYLNWNLISISSKLELGHYAFCIVQFYNTTIYCINDSVLLIELAIIAIRLTWKEYQGLFRFAKICVLYIISQLKGYSSMFDQMWAPPSPLMKIDHIANALPLQLMGIECKTYYKYGIDLSKDYR